MFWNRKVLLIVIFSSIPMVVFSQKADSTKVINNFSGVVSLTNKGISTIPNLTLGKPAMIFDLAIGRKLTFEPQFRFALEGKPWSFLFWGRYKLLATQKFKLNVGAHPALSFKTRSFIINGESKDKIVVDRYLAGELSPTYFLSKDINIGVYYLYSRGIEKDITQNTHYISLRTGFSSIKLSGQFSIRLNPQIYFLIMDNHNGYYFNASSTLVKRNFPISISGLINKTIKSNIPVGKDFLWNITLSYSFSKKFVEL